MAPFHDSLWLVPASVFMGGVLGSPHCVSMCGPIVLNFAQHRSRLLCYQLGRLTSYSLAGAAAGSLGDTLLDSERPVWLSSLALVLIASMLLVNGYRAFYGKSLHLPLPKRVHVLLTKTWKALRLSSLPSTLVAAAGGFLTILFPCGHLYSFLIGAIATGSALKGAAFMFAFGLGSTPLLSFGSRLLHRLLRTGNATRQRWAGVLLLVAGLFGVLAFAAKTENFVRSHQSGKASHHHCH